MTNLEIIKNYDNVGEKMMNNCDNCKNGYWDDYFDSEVMIDSHFVCEKGLEVQDNDFVCSGFEPYEESKSHYELEIPKECTIQCNNQSLQGCTIYFNNINDLRCGDMFVLKSMSRSSSFGVYCVELQKIYKSRE